MEITKTFGNTLRDMMRAKLRVFVRRSVYRYAISIALITMAMHGADQTLTTWDKLSRGLIYFAALCFAIVLLYLISALLQSRRFTPRTVTFTESTLIVDQNGESACHDWGWIISADESSTTISMLIQKLPRLELYLSKHKLDDTEYETLRAWLVSHGKLAPTEIAG